MLPINDMEMPALTRGILAVALVLLFAGVVHGQEQQFAFDANGNLQAQSAENIAIPQILAQPQPQVVVPGALASFFVVAANPHYLTYQWRFNGTNVTGAGITGTAETLVLQFVGATNEGQYSVVLVNSSGSVTSAPAALLLDGDRDGLPDSWEQTYFGGLGQKPTGDFDGDGVSNLDEFLQGTNPADSASVLFRLTVVSDGGNVVVNPGRFTFTNGEAVTLTANAIAPNTFHGWRGATNSMENSISLIMDGNKTVYAYLGSYDLSWTNTSGDWNVASNWSPDIVPGTNDNVFLTRSATVTLNNNTACGSLTLSSGTLAGSGALTLQRDSWWTAGSMSGSGRTIIPAGVTLNLANGSAVSLTTRTLENGGTVLWTGANINMATAVITNRAEALVENRGVGGLAFNGGSGSRFDNAGTFRKTINTGTTTIGGVAFNNYNAVEIQTGTLDLVGGGLNSGTMDFPAGTTLDLSGGTFTGSAASSITGAGQFIVSGGIANLAGLVNLSGNHTLSSGTANLTGNYFCTNNTLTLSGGTANFSGTGTVTPATLNLSGGTLGGNQVVTVLGVMNWTGGSMSGSGRTIIPAGVTLNLANGSAVSLTTRTLENGGTVLWTGANINLSSAVITNRAGALVENRGVGGLAFNGGSGSRFDNAGNFRKTINTGTTIIAGVAFNNYNAVEIQTGILAANGGYTSTTNALLHCAIGGTSAGTGYGRLQVSGTVTLNGALGVSLANGFIPTTNDLFTVLTATTRNGTFGNFYYPSNDVAMQMSNTANSVIVSVSAVLTVPRPTLRIESLSASSVRLLWPTNELPFRLQSNTNINTTNWITATPPPVTLGTNNLVTNTITGSQKFYRLVYP